MPASSAARLVHLVATTAAVVIVTSAALRGLDAFARAYVEPDATTWKTVADLERAAGERLILPAYFPDYLAWPPAEVRGRGGRRPRGTVLTFNSREGRAPHLVVAQTLRGADELPPGLDEGLTELGRDELPGLGPLRQLRAADGTVWRETRVAVAGRTVLLRLRGPRDELARMAESLHREGP